MSKTPQSMIAANFTFKAGVVDAAKAFAKTKPYRGTIDERREKFLALHFRLCEIHAIKVNLEFLGDNNQHQHSGNSCYARAGGRLPTDTIIMVGRLSVVTYLTMFASGIAKGNMNKSTRWAYNLFERAFPKSFARLKINRIGLAESSSQ